MVKRLIEGFYRFREKEYESLKASMPRLVKEGQSPDYFIISCIDSRSNPGAIFRPVPGTFFAHKAMGAIVRPYEKGTALAAALQFALDYNNVREIIILGHTGCGAIQALIEDLQDEEISRFIDVAHSGLEIAKTKCGPECSADKLTHLAEREILLQSTENLKHYPSVARAIKENRITIRAWMFEMETGNLLEYDEDKQSFEKITHENGETNPSQEYA